MKNNKRFHQDDARSEAERILHNPNICHCEGLIECNGYLMRDLRERLSTLRKDPIVMEAGRVRRELKRLKRATDAVREEEFSGSLFEMPKLQIVSSKPD